MREKPREKLSFRGLSVLTAAYAKHGDDVPLADNIRAVLIGYYDVAPGEVDELDSTAALQLFMDVRERFDADMAEVTSLQKKAFEPMASSPIVEPLPTDT